MRCRSLHNADLLPLADVKQLRTLQVGLPPEEHAVARFMLTSSHFHHLNSFDVTDVNTFESDVDN